MCRARASFSPRLSVPAVAGAIGICSLATLVIGCASGRMEMQPPGRDTGFLLDSASLDATTELDAAAPLGSDTGALGPLDALTSIDAMMALDAHTPLDAGADVGTDARLPPDVGTDARLPPDAGRDAGPVSWTYQAEASYMGHAFGRAEADGWSAATGPDARGTWIYGPYTSEIPAGSYVASYRLMVDNHTADNGIVVRIEVNDFDGRGPDCGDCVIASREIRRMEFAGALSYQDFTLAFTNPGGHRLEFRTYWTDISYVREDRIVVTRP